MRVKLRDVIVYSSKRGTANDLKLDSYITTDNLLQNKAGIEQAKSLPPNGNIFPKYSFNDILISNIRPYLKKIWYANKEGCNSSDVLVLKVLEGYYPKYVFYNLLEDKFFEHMMNGAKGTKMPRGDKQQILEYEINHHNRANQIKIADFLSVLDEKILLNNQLNDNLSYYLFYDYLPVH